MMYWFWRIYFRFAPRWFKRWRAARHPEQQPEVW